MNVLIYCTIASIQMPSQQHRYANFKEDELIIGGLLGYRQFHNSSSKYLHQEEYARMHHVYVHLFFPLQRGGAKFWRVVSKRTRACKGVKQGSYTMNPWYNNLFKVQIKS